jgi:hypothetical protein
LKALTKKGEKRNATAYSDWSARVGTSSRAGRLHSLRSRWDIAGRWVARAWGVGGGKHEQM